MRVAKLHFLQDPAGHSAVLRRGYDVSEGHYDLVADRYDVTGAAETPPGMFQERDTEQLLTKVQDEIEDTEVFAHHQACVDAHTVFTVEVLFGTSERSREAQNQSQREVEKVFFLAQDLAFHTELDIAKKESISRLADIVL